MSSNRIGRFILTKHQIVQFPEINFKYSGITILRSFIDYYRQCILYTAQCELFDNVSSGEEIPMYNVYYDSVSAKLMFCKQRNPEEAEQIINITDVIIN